MRWSSFSCAIPTYGLQEYYCTPLGCMPEGRLMRVTCWHQQESSHHTFQGRCQSHWVSYKVLFHLLAYQVFHFQILMSSVPKTSDFEVHFFVPHFRFPTCEKLDSYTATFQMKPPVHHRECCINITDAVAPHASNMLLETLTTYPCCLVTSVDAAS